MARQRRDPTKVAKVGNYMQDVDPRGVDDSMAGTLFGTKMNKVERDYVKGTGRKSSVEAVRRARRANRQPPLKDNGE